MEQNSQVQKNGEMGHFSDHGRENNILNLSADFNFDVTIGIIGVFFSQLRQIASGSLNCSL